METVSETGFRYVMTVRMKTSAVTKNANRTAPLAARVAVAGLAAGVASVADPTLATCVAVGTCSALAAHALSGIGARRIVARGIGVTP